MAVMNLVGTVGTGLTASVGSGAASSASLATAKADAAAIDYTAFAAALAVLVADGASPTQAHVNTANSAWTTLKALIDTTVTDVAAISAGPALTGDVALYVNAATVLTKNKLDEILRAMRFIIEGSSLLTPLH